MNDFDNYTCRRVFITKDSASDVISGDVKSIDGLYGIMTGEMSEAEANETAKKLGDKLVSVYRVL